MPPPLPQSLDAKTIARIDSLYSNAKVMPWLCVAGIFVPLVLLVGGLLGLLYWFWRKALLAQLDALSANPVGHLLPDEGRGGPSLAQKIIVIREAKLTFLSPGIVFIAYAVIVGGLVEVAINT